jgi:hypothetical protein
MFSVAILTGSQKLKTAIAGKTHPAIGNHLIFPAE